MRDRTADGSIQPFFTAAAPPPIVFCNLRLEDRGGHELHADIASMSPDLGARFVFLADGVLPAEVASYLVGSGRPTLMRALALESLRDLALSAPDTLARAATPTLAAPPLPVGALRNDDDPAADFRAQKDFTPWTSAWNVTGMPAVSLPLHWTPDDLPVGVMLAARPAEEELLLALAAARERHAQHVAPDPLQWGAGEAAHRRNRRHSPLATEAGGLLAVPAG